MGSVKLPYFLVTHMATQFPVQGKGLPFPTSKFQNPFLSVSLSLSLRLHLSAGLAIRLFFSHLFRPTHYGLLNSNCCPVSWLI